MLFYGNEKYKITIIADTLNYEQNSHLWAIVGILSALTTIAVGIMLMIKIKRMKQNH